jgi:hypothetical protein
LLLALVEAEIIPFFWASLHVFRSFVGMDSGFLAMVDSWRTKLWRTANSWSRGVSSTIVRTHRTNASRRKEPYRCPVNSCRLKFHSSRQLSSHFQKEHLSSSIEVNQKIYIYPVTTCSRRFYSSGWLSRHFSKFHAPAAHINTVCTSM